VGRSVGHQRAFLVAAIGPFLVALDQRCTREASGGHSLDNPVNFIGSGALVNGVVCALVIDSLLAETKIVGDVLYGLSRFEQVEHLPVKSSRILTQDNSHST
jgi:hypothetical protein